MQNYLSEICRLLAPGGVAYVTFFLYDSLAEAAVGAARHKLRFPYARQYCALARSVHPTNAVAYMESFVRQTADSLHLSVIGPPMYGEQDVLLLARDPAPYLRPLLLHGWHPLEQNCWRWTERRFAFSVHCSLARAFRLQFRFILPEGVVSLLGSLRLIADVGGHRLAPSDYSEPGEHLYSHDFTTSSNDERLLICFELDKAYGPSHSDARELGVQVAFASCVGDVIRPLEPLSLVPLDGSDETHR